METNPTDLRSLVAVALEQGPTPASVGVVVAYQGKADSVELGIMEDRFPPVGPMKQDDGIWYGSIPVDEDGSAEYRLGGEHRRKEENDPRPNQSGDRPKSIREELGGDRAGLQNTRLVEQSHRST